MSSPPKVPLLGELLDVPEVRTVIRLSDAADERLRPDLARSFVVTEAARSHLEVVLGLLGSGKGGAGFIVGNYGTGKSHLLALLSAICADEAARAPIGAATPQLEPALRRLGTCRLLTVRASLLDHSASERLEDVILSAWSGATQAPLPRAGSRADRARQLLDASRERGHSAVVLLLDELSEFLRSKPDGPSFTEDVRTLQFLGELTIDAPVVVLAALQEQVEATGDLSPDTLAKIKDRYRIRLHLRAEHIEQIVADRLLRRRPGGAEAIRTLARRVREALPDLSIPQDRLERLWPIHPATLAWLDELREFFSRQRGALDFVCGQLRGDPARADPGRLDRPADEVVTPDVLYDHFVPRILEDPELRPYHDVVMGWFSREGVLSIPDSQRVDATRALKVLLLARISPARRPLGPRQIAEALLLSKSRIDPAANRRYAAELLSALSRAGTFVRPVAGPESGEGVSYEVDYRADASLAVARRLAEAERRLGHDDRRPFWTAARGIQSDELPLSSLVLGGDRRVRWQNTARAVGAHLRDLDDIDDGEIDRLLGDLGSGALDAVLLMGTCLGLPVQRKHAEERILPRLCSAPDRLGQAVAIWIPGVLADDGARALRRAHALMEIAEGYRADETDAGRAARAYLVEPLAEARRKAQTTVLDAYARGEILLAGGPTLSPSQLGPSTFERLVTSVADRLCTARYPRHLEVRPGSDVFGADALQAALVEHVRGPAGAPLSAQAFRVVQDLMRPLGLVRAGRGRAPPELEVSAAKSAAVAELLAAIGRHARPGTKRAPLAEVERDLRAGPFGLCPAAFQILCLTLLSTGHVTGHAGGRLKPAEQVEAATLRTITELGLGQVVDAEVWRRVTALPFVPARYRGAPATVPVQADLARDLGRFRVEVETAAHVVRRAVERVRGFRCLAHSDLEGALRDADAADRLARSLAQDGAAPASYVVGLEQAVRSEPDLVGAFERTGERARFFTERLDLCVRLHDYLHHPGLRLPESSAYEEIARLLATARSLLSDEARSLDSSFGQKATPAFEELRSAWAERLVREHQALAEDPGFAELEALRREEPYRLLTRLSSLPGAASEHDRVAIDRVLEAARSRRCTRLRPEVLHQRPVCDCGFSLGQRLELPARASVEERILRGLAELSGSLLRGPAAERLRAAAGGLAAVGRDADRRTLVDLLELVPAAADAAPSEILHLARALGEAEPLLHEALRSPIEVLERDGDALLERLAGRTLPVGALREAVERWLSGEGGVSPASYVRVGSALLAPHDALLRGMMDLAAQRFPELSRLGGKPNELLLLAALARAGADHGAPPEAWALFVERQDAVERAPALAGLATAVLLEHQEAATLCARASDALEPLGLDALGRALCPGEEPEALARALGAERILPGLSRSFARRFLRAAEASAGHLPVPQAAPGPTQIADLRTELVSACAARARLRAAALAARDLGGRSSARALTELYREAVHSVERDAAWLDRTARRHDLLDAAGGRSLRQEVERTLALVGSAFEAILGERYQAWLDDGRGGPTFLDRAVQLVRERVQKDLGQAPAAAVLVDALRWDVWSELRSRLESGSGRSFRVIHELAAWAHRPTTTAVNLDRLRRGAAPDGDPLLDGMVHVRSLDLRVHHGREAPDLLVQEAATDLHAELCAWADGLAPRSVFVLFADHGFVEDRDFDPAAPHDRPRYRHGGDSPFEIVVPVAALLRL